MNYGDSGHWLRRAWRAAFDWAGPMLVAANLLALVGFTVRDRTAGLALLLYVPLAPLGAASMGLDLARRGRAVPRARFALSAIGLAAVACSAWTLVGLGPARAAATAGDEVRLLHWNVLWGGRSGPEVRWASMEATIVAHAPDVVVLNESPPDGYLESLRRRLGDGWTSTQLSHEPGRPYWYKLAAFSRWPVRPGRRVEVRNGTALAVEVDRPGRPIRLLVVDGQSKVTQLRTPFLHDVAEACRRAEEAGEPFDFVAGDFNAVGRSLGFEELREAAGGYEPASASSVGWRATWPAPLPVYDIDHVWIRAGWRIVECSIFTTLASDHRGQLVRLLGR